jgi:four helix bundle protein
MAQVQNLLGRVHEFALAALEFYRSLPKTREAQASGDQFYRASKAMWSNYRAAKRERSRAEFIAKLGVVVEEADEAVGWLEHMRDGRIASDAALLSEAEQLLKIFGKSLGTSRRNHRSQDNKTKRSKILRSQDP